MRKATPRLPRAQLLSMRLEARELAAKTLALTERMEQLVGRLQEVDPAELARLKELASKTAATTEQMEQLAGCFPEAAPAELARLKRQLDLVLQIFERRGPDSVDGKADKA